MNRKLNLAVITRFTKDNYYGVLLEGINEVLKDNDANMVVINTFMLYRFNDYEERDSIYFPLATDYIDGWIILTQGVSKKYLEYIYNTGKPVILISSEHENEKYNTVKEDNIYGAEIATQHLIDHGHKKIAFIGWLDLFDMHERFLGYKKALKNNGIEFDQSLVIKTEEAIAHCSYQALEDVLKKKIQFTAVLAGNDLLAFGTMQAIKKVGLKIPEDVAIIGYDNTIQASNVVPALTTINQNVRDKAVIAAQKLLKLVKGEIKSIETIKVKSNLIVRNSCGCKAKMDSEEITLKSIKTKESAIKYLEEYHEKSFILGSKLLTSNIDQIIKMIPDIVDNYSWRCLGLWREGIDNKKELYIQKVIDPKIKKDLDLNSKAQIEKFPLEEILPDKNKEDVIWIIPISSSSMELGILSFISPFPKINRQLTYDSSINLFNLLGIAIDRELANLKLKNTLKTLEKTQEQLVQSEKMVSLGSLVAGVAHEINTPIGVSVTAASHIKDQSDELRGLFETGRIKRSSMEDYLETCDEVTNVLLINLKKASDLIKSFKQVAVDQSTEEKRKFKIKEYLDEILLSLNPELKRNNIKVTVKCEEDIEIYSNPSSLYQIVMNLVLNSLIHAYDVEDEGRIFIDIGKENSEMFFTYSDDGKGMDKKIIKNIFDPFFTTNRAKGGTGLGLNIVYNIIVQEFKGSIECKSDLGEGTTFLIRFPIREV
ncbi:substrate-binding domain-containing protein [Herbivorax sp. ANBcel31]|uniref:substrate-binding domain-containing protein n=1 Tax=Herbivorax sp. ANBcel31 TaxID=3069754 RepID=UPI0027B30016|nr:substrate-binding domain-containing protein [Herbivorax sp. ANBcel31]MDQ2087185.1 substrate-binding domain-containing protein [Herbivorax sp. ANBcel31]